MSFALTTVTGAAVTGLTSPTYTMGADQAPSVNGKQFAVLTLGGTQSGVRTHSMASPFSATWFRDPSPKQLGALNQNGQLMSVPMNKHRLIVRCGMLPLAGQPYKPAVFRGEFDIPAGAELADTAQLKAMVSFLAGLLWGEADDLFSTLSTGVS